MSKRAEQVRLANRLEDFERLHIEKGAPSPKEDGMRSSGMAGTYEWWYNDAEFDDGSKIVTVFYTKDYFDVPGPARPTVDIDIRFPDGSKMSKNFQLPAGETLNASREQCNVTIGKSYLRYEGNYYILHFETEDLVYHALMISSIPMWRPGTGHWLYGDDEAHYFAWFVAQPSSVIEATLTINGETTLLSGTGYHDHNWGNMPMDKLMNHWYWGRAKIDNFDVIACDIIAEEKYGYQRLPVFMLAKAGQIITDDQSLTQISRRITLPHPITHKFMDNHLIYSQPISDSESYKVEFIREGDTISFSLLTLVSKLKRSLGRLLGMNPTYTRVFGKVRLTHFLNDEKTVWQQEGLWEQMFFGSNKHATINDSREHADS